MSNSHIEFESDVQGNPLYSASGPGSMVSNKGPSGMVGWLIRHGIVRSDSVGKGILIGVIVIDFAIAGLILYFYVLR
jgi:hypothetical protein